ncbi:chromosome transmission fidelity protein 4 [Schistosoma bovis]|uniref:Chromosome transmission fidelity protein 4 n=2 Tax=Schistosoma TaxID=6181 RepID=A0A430Q6F7_SCHBO|nr:chromosome transmission fidelity protein 4 [Schistosoma bovis]
MLWPYVVFFSRIVTGGSDGKIKIFESLDDACPVEHIVGEKINAIACRYENVIVATEGTYVHILQMEDGLPDGVATRFTAEVNHLAMNKDLSKIALCSSDFSVKVVDLSGHDNDRELVFKGHQGAVLSVAFDPLDVFVASASCDGSVRLWDLIIGEEKKCIYTLAKCNDPLFAPSSCRLCWESTVGKPSSRDSLSPNRIAELMGCDEDGDTADLLSAAAAQAESSRLLADDDVIPHPNEDDSNSDSIDLSRIKSDYMSLNDEAEEKQAPAKIETKATVLTTEDNICPKKDNVTIQPLQKAFQSGATPLGFRERFMVWNRIGIVTQFRDTAEYQSEDDASNQFSGGSIEVEFHDNSLHHSLRLSNSSGYSMADLSLTALLLASKGSDDPNLDDLNDDEQNELYDLSRIAILPLDVGSSNIGDASVEWTTTLPPGELCDAVCLVTEEGNDKTESPGYAVVATSKCLLRIFTQPSPSSSMAHSSNLRLLQINKLGLPPISLSGHHTVVLASHPNNPILAVVTCNVVGELEWRVFYLGGIMLGSNRTAAPLWMKSSLSIWQHLPLSPPLKHTSLDTSVVRLTWFGFSDTGGLFTYDSNGVVRRLIHGRSQRHPEFHWVPICDTRSLLKQNNRRTDNYFVVGVLESCESVENLSSENKKDLKSNVVGFGQLQAIYCKASKWPRVFPRPVVSNISFRLPLCSMNTDQSDLEENYLQCIISEDWPIWGPNITDANEDILSHLLSLNTKSLTKRKAVLLRLFAVSFVYLPSSVCTNFSLLAAKLESDWASLAIANMMPDAATVQLAIRYAGRLRRQNLAHRLAGVALEKERRVSETVEVDDWDDIPQSSTFRGKCNRDPTTFSGYSPSNNHIHSHSKTSRPTNGSDYHDVADSSLVSSGTDDGHIDGSINNLPLADSESLSHSVLTPSSRNPFKSSHEPKEFAPRSIAHGTELLDAWTPKTTATNTKVSQKPDVNKTQNNKKRSLSVSLFHLVLRSSQRSKLPKMKSVAIADADQEFTDWFEENRDTLEESYPEVSVEELVRIGQSEYRSIKSSKDGVFDGKEKENVLQSNTKRPLSENDDLIQCNSNATKRRLSEFENNVSKRMSSFAFSQNSSK